MDRLRTLTVSRHTQHRPSEGDPLVYDSGLTCSGVEEARAIGRKLHVYSPDTLLTYDSYRALSSIVLADNPTADGDKLLQEAYRLQTEGRLELHDNLDYIEPRSGEFADRLLESYLDFHNFEFLVNESDIYDSDIEPISSYSRMASIGAAYMLDSRRSEAKLHVCSREFIFAATAAKLIQLTEGKGVERNFARWYSDNIEKNDLGRTAITAIVSDSKNLKITNDLYTINAPLSHVKRIFEERD